MKRNIFFWVNRLCGEKKNSSSCGRASCQSLRRASETHLACGATKRGARIARMMSQERISRKSYKVKILALLKPKMLKGISGTGYSEKYYFVWDGYIRRRIPRDEFLKKLSSGYEGTLYPAIERAEV